MGKSASAPPQVDSARLTAEQARANRLTQFLPGGSALQFGETLPGTMDFVPSDRAQQALRVIESPFDQQQRLSREGIAGALANRAQTQVGNLPVDPISFEGLAGLPGVDDFGAERGRVENALFSRARGLLDPVFEQRERSLMQGLSNRGVPEGGELYQTQVGNFDRDRSNTYTNLAMDAVQAGGQEQNRMFGLASSARNQGLQERLTGRQLAFNELASLLGGQQLQPSAQLQNFIPPAQVDVVGPAQLAQQSAMAGFNARQQSQQGLMGGLFGLGAAGLQGVSAAGGLAAFMCSRSYKTNGRPVEVILPRLRALTVEAWDYRDGIEDGGTHIGPYAEDFHALFGVGSDKTIHPVDAFGVCLLAIKELDAKVTELAHG